MCLVPVFWRQNGKGVCDRSPSDLGKVAADMGLVSGLTIISLPSCRL